MKRFFCAWLAIWMTLPLVWAADEARELPAPSSDGTVFVIPIRGTIENALLYVIRRGLQEAQITKAQAVVFVMDTPGGTLAAASDIVRTIQALEIPTYTFVEKDAFSAGAIIAMSTEHIFMAPGSVIGDAMPIMVSPWGGVQELSSAHEEKAVSGVAALVRSAAQKAGHSPELAEKMVRRENELRMDDELISPAGQLLTLTNVEAERLLANGQPLLSEGTVSDVPALLERIGLQGAQIQEMSVTRAERLARWIAAMAPILMMLGFLGIYIEFKTPGFGLPGIFGVVCLALFFWGHHIAGLAGWEEMIIFGIGVALLACEIFLFPGFGIAGFLGVILMAGALGAAMIRMVPGQWSLPAWPDMQLPILNLTIALVGTIAMGILLAKWLPKSSLGSQLILTSSTSREAGYQSATPTVERGREGVAWTDLRPAGVARFEKAGNVDVVTSGEFIPKGEAIRVAEVHGMRVVVEKISPSPMPSVSSIMQV